MFDWLFGNNKEKDALQSQSDEAFKQKFIANYMNDKMGAQRANFGGISDSDWNYNMENLRSYSDQSNSAYDDINKQLGDYNKKNKYNYFGNGLIGSILNPIGQTASAVTDLATGDYAKNGRDLWSDLGAAGETALTVLPGVGALAKGAKLGKVASGIDKFNKAAYTIPGSMATGAVWGGLDKVREDGAQVNPMDILGSAGTGAAFGGIIPAVGKYGGNMLQKRGTNVLQRSMARSGIDNDVAQQLLTATPKRALYQEALRSYIPKSTFGKVALGGGALYGGSQLMGMMSPQQPQTLEDYYAMQNGGY